MSAPVATRTHGAGARMPPFAAEASALALVLAAVAYVATRNLHTYPNYDEGNYLGSLDALRHGQALGKDVFLDQPPGWYLLLVAVSYPFGNSDRRRSHRTRGRRAHGGGRRLLRRAARRRSGRRRRQPQP